MARFFHIMARGPLPDDRARPQDGYVTIAPVRTQERRLHRAWIVAAVAGISIIGAAGFRATPGVLITPLQEEFGWSRGTISAAVSVNLLLFGLTAPFAAALLDRFGIRRTVATALLLIAA